MKKLLRVICLCFFTAVILTAGAFASENTLKVGLYYGSSALFSANLQNYQGSGYELGWFDEESREFYYVGYLTEEKISMTVDGKIYISGGSYYADPPAAADTEVGGYHVQLDDAFETFEEARYAADQFSGAFPAYINGTYRVRVGDYLPVRRRRSPPPPTRPIHGMICTAASTNSPEPPRRPAPPA